MGCNTFDTAHVYGSGDNERTFGRWLRERGNRNKVNIIGKGAHHEQIDRMFLQVLEQDLVRVTDQRHGLRFRIEIGDKVQGVRHHALCLARTLTPRSSDEYP